MISLSRYSRSATICLVLVVAFVGTSCRQAERLPSKSSKEYNDIVRAFYVGLAALQVGDDVRADKELARVTELVAAEPAGWANWGLLALRQRNFDLASDRLDRARVEAPDNDQIYYLIGLLEKGRGRSSETITALRKAIELNPKNLLATFTLAEEIERQGEQNSTAESQRLVEKILEVEPTNLAALLESGRIAAKRGEKGRLQQIVQKISERSSAWPPEVQEQLTALRTAISGSDQQAVTTKIAFLRNVMVRVPDYRRDLSAIKPPPGEEAQPFLHFLKIETATFTPAPADTEISFSPEPIPNLAGGKWSWIGAFSLNGEGAPVVAVANQSELRIANRSYPFPGGTSDSLPEPNGIVALDFNYDFKTDLILIGAGGIRLLKQENGNEFADVTTQTKLPSSILKGSFRGGWAADIDADGDLDVVLGAQGATPAVLRNNGDGSFAEIHPFSGVTGLHEFIWADIDGDGDPDAALIDEKDQSLVDRHLHVFSNERNGQFKKLELPSSLSALRTISVGDPNGDGVLDLLAVQEDGAIIRISTTNEGQSFEINRISSFDNNSTYLHREFRLQTIDLDNNGGNDLLLTFSESPQGKNVPGAIVWLSDEQNRFHLVQNRNPPPGVANPDWVGPDIVFQPADVNGDGRLDLLGLSFDGQPIQAISHGTKNYHWQVIRPRAAQTTGDQRINSFGIGGEMEIRAGLLVQKQLIAGPIVHFGLGEQTSADVVRIVWPNGAVRAEFETKADQPILAEQRLKGSCPFLFAFNGKEMKFVKDAVPWSSAIGLRINTLGTARVEATEEWYKIGGDELVPRDGYYDLRITAELWETYYYDQLSLMTVDHPTGTEVFVDERFVIPPAKLAITTVEVPHKIVQALDDNGNDVTAIVSALDEKYLDTFGRGRYQGVTRDHYVEVDLGNNVPDSGPLWLIAKGWMHPTDSSINVAISQGQEVQAAPLSMEVPDGKGRWVVAYPNLGFPSGRKKICLFDLAGVFRPGTPRRVRLRTNLEIFWDSIEWAKGLSDGPLKTIHISPETADLHYRGYSVINKPNDSSPEVPDYNRLASSKQIWRDLIGNYTRFGDVRELLQKIDDRYVIMNAGDEMTFRFPAQPPPANGWIRDYILIGDGWIKDGDYNSTFSKTVLPLPYHAKQQYVENPGRLEDEWVYKQHPEDWQKYHTRYVTPEVFRDALRTDQR
jgi:tetratricopeptide (TPR) repeat protein